jgi:hypothetical protein
MPNNVHRAIGAFCLLVALYLSIFGPAIVIYPSNRVVYSTHCTGHRDVAYECNKLCYYDLAEPFCILVTNNCTLALSNITHVQLGSVLYWGASEFTQTTGVLSNGHSILSLQNDCAW